MERRILAKTEAETIGLGERLAGLLTAPAFVALYGGLGAGKTAFVRGMGRALGTEEVASPTFTILREYDTRPRLLHFDAYRLSGAEELRAVGFEEYLSEAALLVIEWADIVPAALPEERLDVELSGSGGEPRTLLFRPFGERYERAVSLL